MDEPTVGVARPRKMASWRRWSGALAERRRHRGIRGARHGRGRALRRPRRGLEPGAASQHSAPPPTCSSDPAVMQRGDRDLTMLTLEEGLRVDIAGVPVLRDVTSALAPGGRVALIGRNGAGKTTTLRALMGFVAAASATVRSRRSRRAVPPHRRPPRHRLCAGGPAAVRPSRCAENMLLPAWRSAAPAAEDAAPAGGRCLAIPAAS